MRTVLKKEENSLDLKPFVTNFIFQIQPIEYFVYCLLLILS